LIFALVKDHTRNRAPK